MQKVCTNLYPTLTNRTIFHLVYIDFQTCTYVHTCMYILACVQHVHSNLTHTDLLDLKLHTTGSVTYVRTYVRSYTGTCTYREHCQSYSCCSSKPLWRLLSQIPSPGAFQFECLERPDNVLSYHHIITMNQHSVCIKIYM